MAMFRMVPPVIRGCNASELQAIVREYGDPPHDDHEVSTAKEGDDPDLPNDEPCHAPLAVLARLNQEPAPLDVIGPEVQDLLSEMPSELLDLMGLRGGLEEGAPVDDLELAVDEELVENIIDANA